MILERLDTIIAFVVILAGVSLLVTVSPKWFPPSSERGSNLRWGIELCSKSSIPASRPMPQLSPNTYCIIP